MRSDRAASCRRLPWPALTVWRCWDPLVGRLLSSPAIVAPATAATAIRENATVREVASATSDRLALGALAAARERGVQVPGELSLVGFDDVPQAAMATPPPQAA